MLRDGASQLSLPLRAGTRVHRRREQSKGRCRRTSKCHGRSCGQHDLRLPLRFRDKSHHWDTVRVRHLMHVRGARNGLPCGLVV